MGTDDELTQRVTELVQELAPNGAEHVTLDQRIIEDLGYDSVTTVELAILLETEFDIGRIEETDAMQISTVRDLVEFVVTARQVPQ